MILSTAELQQHPTFISTSFSLYISFIQANTQSVSAPTMCAIQSNANSCMPSAPLACSGSPPRCCKHLPSIYIYIYAPYVRLTVNFLLLHGQDGRPLRSPLRATQILATDSFKREGNRTKRCGHYNLSPRQGYRHGKLKYRQLTFLHVREFHRTLSEVVSRSLLYTMPTGTPLRRTLSNTTASENLLPPCLFAFWQHGTHCHCGILKDCLPHC